MVRRRAYGQKPTQASSSDYKLADYASKDAFLALVLQERGYETIFEGKRYNDLEALWKACRSSFGCRTYFDFIRSGRCSLLVAYPYR